MKTREKKPIGQKPCKNCDALYTYYRSRSQFCSEICGAQWLYKVRNKVIRERKCDICQTEFSYKRGERLRFCSDKCATISAKEARLNNARFLAQWRKENPDAIKVYNDRRKETHPKEVKSGMPQRFFKKYPHIKPICQSCGESRIVELAHKIPRNGAWRTLRNTTENDVWILCPTCHRLLDFGICSKQELGIE